jgi:hypothetical protein
MIDLAIAYRVYPRVSGKPVAWADDKFRLSTVCLQSFRQALGPLRVKIWALLDGCPPEYKRLFRHYFSEEELQIVPLNGVGNHATFTMQLELLAQQRDADLVYFAEDDYLYFPDALVKMVNFTRHHSDVDFVTPYDHPDTYNESSRHERHQIRPFEGQYWRTATSTCLTFLARRDALIRTANLFRSYGQRNNDGSLWLSITEKFGLLDPRAHFHDWSRAKLWLKAWYWGHRQILFRRSYKLWSPIPSLSTHLESTYLAPVIDWNAEARRAEQEAAACCESLRASLVEEFGNGGM